MATPFSKKLSSDTLNVIASRFKALSEPSRLRLLMALGKEEKSVGDLTHETGLEQTNVSRHLQMLTNVGILARRKEGLSVFYKVADECIFRICDLVCGSTREHLEAKARAFK